MRGLEFECKFNPEFPLGNLMEKKQFLWDFCSYSRVNSELFTTKRDEKHQKVFFYTNLVPKARLMENLGLNRFIFANADQTLFEAHRQINWRIKQALT